MMVTAKRVPTAVRIGVVMVFVAALLGIGFVLLPPARGPEISVNEPGDGDATSTQSNHRLSVSPSDDQRKRFERNASRDQVSDDHDSGIADDESLALLKRLRPAYESGNREQFTEVVAGLRRLQPLPLAPLLAEFRNTLDVRLKRWSSSSPSWEMTLENTFIALIEQRLAEKDAHDLREPLWEWLTTTVARGRHLEADKLPKPNPELPVEPENPDTHALGRTARVLLEQFGWYDELPFHIARVFGHTSIDDSRRYGLLQMSICRHLDSPEAIPSIAGLSKSAEHPVVRRTALAAWMRLGGGSLIDKQIGSMVDKVMESEGKWMNSEEFIGEFNDYVAVIPDANDLLDATELIFESAESLGSSGGQSHKLWMSYLAREWNDADTRELLNRFDRSESLAVVNLLAPVIGQVLLDTGDTYALRVLWEKGQWLITRDWTTVSTRAPLGNVAIAYMNVAADISATLGMLEDWYAKAHPSAVPSIDYRLFQYLGFSLNAYPWSDTHRRALELVIDRLEGTGRFEHFGVSKQRHRATNPLARLAHHKVRDKLAERAEKAQAEDLREFYVDALLEWEKEAQRRAAGD